MLKIAKYLFAFHVKHKTCHFLLSAGENIAEGWWCLWVVFFLVLFLMLNSFLFVGVHFLCVNRKGFLSLKPKHHITQHFKIRSAQPSLSET